MSDPSSRLQRLRQSFDSSFSKAPAEPQATVDVLLLRVGETERAIRMDQITRVARAENIVAVPSRAPSMIGLVGIRGAVTPAFSMATLLGLPPTESRWLLVVSGSNAQQQIAFACEGILGFVRIPLDQVELHRAVALEGGRNVALLDLYELRSRVEAHSSNRSKQE